MSTHQVLSHRQSNLYCKNTADRTQRNNKQTQRKPY